MGIGQEKELLRRFLELDRGDQQMLVKATWWLAVARVWLLVLPFRKLASRLGSGAGTGTVRADPEMLRRVGRAVSTAAAHVPWRADCFPQSIAASRLLKRLGYCSTIHFGVSRSGGEGLDGHLPRRAHADPRPHRIWQDAGGISLGHRSTCRPADTTARRAMPRPVRFADESARL